MEFNSGGGKPLPEFEKTTVVKKERQLLTVDQVYEDLKINGLVKGALDDISDLAKGMIDNQGLTGNNLKEVQMHYPGLIAGDFKQLLIKLREGMQKGEIKIREPRL